MTTPTRSAAHSASASCTSSNTVALPSSDPDEHLVLGGSKFHYNRSSSIEVDQLTLQLKKLYDTPDALIASSGMNAIHTILQTLGVMRSWLPFNLVYSNELYTDTPRLFKYFSSSYSACSLHEFDPLQTGALGTKFATELKGKDNVLFVEACSNPSGFIFDHSILPALRAHSRSLTVVVDNTWLSGVVFNPLDFGADIVMVSLTKYYSGGTAIGGAVLSRDVPFLKAADDYLRITGAHVSPHNAQLISHGMTSQLARITQSSKLTLDLIARVQTHPNLRLLSHPMIPVHPSHQLALKYFRRTSGGQQLCPSVMSFTVSCASKSQALKTLSKFSSIEHKTSFGAAHSRTDPWPKAADGLVVCRLAVGYADTDIATLSRNFVDLLDRFPATPTKSSN
jgi:cystathionine beta-lyase/cystathionine gamma-synthase